MNRKAFELYSDADQITLALHHLQKLFRKDNQKLNLAILALEQEKKSYQEEMKRINKSEGIDG